jgi:hypothetical protein
MGLRCGKGLWKRVYEDGSFDQYCGFYENDKKNGFGHFIWANGNEYKGEFFNDYKHGKGEMKFKNG